MVSSIQKVAVQKNRQYTSISDVFSTSHSVAPLLHDYISCACRERLNPYCIKYIVPGMYHIRNTAIQYTALSSLLSILHLSSLSPLSPPSPLPHSLSPSPSFSLPLSLHPLALCTLFSILYDILYVVYIYIYICMYIYMYIYIYIYIYNIVYI